jgi:hypothetical protein
MKCEAVHDFSVAGVMVQCGRAVYIFNYHRKSNCITRVTIILNSLWCAALNEECASIITLAVTCSIRVAGVTCDNWLSRHVIGARLNQS